ncbi:MAG: hypothetical protein COA47_14905 [Robiginitomaculum sp.]|nr:MAG: hypothetical protein COA47_14905 [Robiginitomaculum sp.]
MTLFSSRLVLALSALNILVLIWGGLTLALYDEGQLPDVTSLPSGKLLTNMSERSQRSPVQMASLEQRPMFHQNRKQYTVKKAPPIKKQQPQRATPLTAYQLKGIVYIKGGKSFIIVINRNSKKSWKLRTGEIFDGWTVKSISKASVDLVKGTEVARLKLIKSANNRK